MEILHRIDSTDPYREANMRSAMCPSCRLNNTCKKHEMLPVISPLSAYIIRYHNEIEAGFAIYPQPGTWLDQYPWFLKGLESVRATEARMRKEDHDREMKKYGKS